MRFPFIRTTQTAVSALKKHARSISKADGRPYQQALEVAAKTARYLSWHHVAWCEEQTRTFVGPLQPAFDPFVDGGPGSLADQFILFSVPRGPDGDEQRERARREGIRVSEDGRFLMFPHDLHDEDSPEPMPDYCFLSDSDL